jgi:hypothetical protein
MTMSDDGTVTAVSLEEWVAALLEDEGAVLVPGDSEISEAFGN